jgi:hypothetical protein
MSAVLAILKAALPGIIEWLGRAAGPLIGFLAGRKTQKTADRLAGAEAELEIRREDDVIEQKVDGMTSGQVNSELSKWSKK